MLVLKMLQKQENHRILNLIFVTIIGLAIDTFGSTLIPSEQQKVLAQGGIQVRSDQWLRVDKITGNVTYRNLYNYANRPARVGDRLQVVSDEISTGANSSAILSVDTAVGTIYVTENTTVQIRSFQRASDNGRITNLYIPRGKARMQIRKFTNRGSQLNIQTPAGISGVRGTQYIVIAQPNQNMVILTLDGQVASTAQKRSELVNAGYQNLTVFGKAPLPPVPIVNDSSLRYSINKQSLGTGRSISFVGYTNAFNTVKVDGLDQSLDSNGKFSLQLPAKSSLKVNVKVETPLGKVQVYEIPIL